VQGQSEETKPGEQEAAATILYIHGGGFISGSTATHKGLISRLLGATGPGAHALSVEYRLAPEHRAPAAAEDVSAAYHWLVRDGPKPVDPTNLSIVADSAGANLAVVLVRDVLSARAAEARTPEERAQPVAASLVLMSPWFNLGCEGESYSTNKEIDHLPVDAVHLAARLYAGEGSTLQELSVLDFTTDHAQLWPPTLVQTGTADLCHSDSLAFAASAADVGASVRLSVFEDMVHTFMLLQKAARPHAANAVAEAGEFIRAHHGDQTSNAAATP
jgi:monoterpene epsilon-lactone hydrolase